MKRTFAQLELHCAGARFPGVATIEEEGRIRSLLQDRENIWQLLLEFRKTQTTKYLEDMFSSLYPIIDGRGIYNIVGDQKEDNDENEEFYEVNLIQ